MLKLRKLLRNFVFLIPLVLLVASISFQNDAAAVDTICMVGGGQNCEPHTFSCGADICDNGEWTRLCIVCVEP
jgi:hypothetical protein